MQRYIQNNLITDSYLGINASQVNDGQLAKEILSYSYHNPINLSNINGFRVVYFLSDNIFTSGSASEFTFNATIYIYVTNGTDTATHISGILQPTSNTLPVAMQNNVIDIIRACYSYWC